MAKKIDLGLGTYDSLFSTEEERKESKLEKIVKLNISQIEEFDGHPFHVRMDDDMVKLIDSVQENGVLVPVLVRPKKDGIGYEMISGHRRKFALQSIGATEIDAIIRDLDDDQSTILMVDSNIQRENILPTERAYAYKMRYDAMKNQGKRNDLTYGQVVHKSEYKKKSIHELAEALGENYKQIQRYIRLTELINPLQKMVDGIHEDGFKISFLPAYELSFLNKIEQHDLVNVIYDTLATPSLAQAQELKRKSQKNELNKEFIQEMLIGEKPNQREKISFKQEEINKFFPKTCTPKQQKEIILKLLENWQKRRDREQTR